MVGAGAVQLPERCRELIVERLAAFDPVGIFVFGSRARGESGAQSDVDLLVEVERRDDGRRQSRGPRVVVEAAEADLSDVNLT